MASERVAALAKADRISVRLELPPILEELNRQRLIDRGDTGVAILGLTTAQVLEYTAEIFDGTSPGSCEKAAIDLAEKASELPIEKQVAAEYVSDTYQIP